MASASDFKQKSAFQNRDVFMSDGNFTVPSGVEKIWVQLWGGGAGGSVGSSFDPGIPGGAGGYCEKIISVTGGSNFTVTIGAGGAGKDGSSSGLGSAGGLSEFGTILDANGGNVEDIGYGNGSSGGGASGGDINVRGGSASQGPGSGALTPGGMPVGWPSDLVVYATNNGPNNLLPSAPGFGAGGSGGESDDNVDAQDGADGLCVVWY